MADINWKCGCWVATVYLVRPDNKVLLNWNKNLQTWIPVGGHIDPGETPDEAVVREVKEETGFEFSFLPESHLETGGKVRVIKPHRVQVEQVPHHGFHINLIFIGKCLKWDDKLATDEDEKLRWFSEEELLAEKPKMLDNVWSVAMDALRSAKSFKQ